MIHKKFKIAKMSANQSILDDLILHISPDKFYVESLTFTESVLVIDRISYEISLQASNGQIPNMASRKPIAGIMGIISLMSGPYLVVITKKARLGALQVISSLCHNHTTQKFQTMIYREAVGTCGEWWRLRLSATPGLSIT